MAENSTIEWTTHTFNPWIGCTNVSAACDHCYAEAWAERFGQVEWGPHGARKRTSAANWRKPLKWNRQAEGAAERPRVFCASLADVFDNHKSILPDWRADLWQLIRDTPNLDWLLLTKRPQNIQRYLPDDWAGGWPNVWLGTTVENQTEAERRIPHLLKTGARVKFLSCEPLQGPIDLEIAWHGESALDPECWGDCGWCKKDYPALHNCAWGRQTNAEWLKGRSGLDWIITGGESGPHYRPADPDWFRSLRDQCADAGVPFLFKQWEGKSQAAIKKLGRELDGVVHDGYPDPREVQYR